MFIKTWADLDEFWGTVPYEVMTSTDEFLSIVVIVMLVVCYVKKYTSRTFLNVGYFLLIPVFSLRFAMLPSFLSIIPACIITAVGIFLGRSKYVLGRLEKEEKQSMTCPIEKVMNKQKEEFSKLTEEEQEIWYKTI